MNRVVITGIGILSPVGNGCKSFWQGLISGLSGIRPITLFDASSFPVRIGAEVKEFDISAISREFPDAASLRDRKVFLGLAAARQAVSDSQLEEKHLKGASLHIGVGLEMLCLEDLVSFAQETNISKAIANRLLEKLDGRLLQTPLDSTAEILGNKYGFLAGRYTNCSACAAGAQSIGDAWHLVRRGDVSVALAGATDSMLNPLGLGGFSILRVLSDENNTPEKACRPFDVTRKGTALGEGAAFLVLERLEHALSRGARIVAEVLGYGSSMDAFRVSDPDPDGKGAIQSMLVAMEEAGLAPEQIDCVNAHGTGTPKNDVVETNAIKKVLGARAYEVPVHAVKSMTGHMIAASGAVEAAAAALTIAEKRVPPTINLEKPDPECDLDYVVGKARQFYGMTVLSNSFGFGGQNATLVFGRYS